MSEQKCSHCKYPLDKDGKCLPCENRRLASEQADRREAGSGELLPSALPVTESVSPSVSRAADAFEEAAKEVDAYWKFSDYQQPLSSWHDKQDLLELLRSKAKEVRGE